MHGGKVGVVPGAVQRRVRSSGVLAHSEGVAALFTRDVLHGFGLFLDAGGRAVELHQQHGLLAQVEFAVRLTMRTVLASISSTRAIGTPSWMVWMVVFTASAMLGKEHTGGDTSGQRVQAHGHSVITPSVPSLPTMRRVRS